MQRTTVCLLSLVLASSTLWAAQMPRGVATDNRVKTVAYDEHNVVSIKGHYGYQVTVEFAPEESIEVISLGDSIAWQAVPAKNLLFLKPTEQNAATNLTVVTSKRAYTFELSAAETKNPKDKTLTYRLQFKYPNEEAQAKAQLASTLVNPKADAGTTPQSWNFDYKIKGDDDARPLRVFDDGQFTYFQFEKRQDVPAIFWVDDNDQESLINYRIEGQFVVVERLGKEFKLRSDDDVACIKRNS